MRWQLQWVFGDVGFLQVGSFKLDANQAFYAVMYVNVRGGPPE